MNGKMEKKEVKRVSSEELEKKFDQREDVSDYFDWDAATKKINLDLPVWAIKEVDKEATRRGIARQALLKGWIVDRIDALKEKDQKAS